MRLLGGWGSANWCEWMFEFGVGDGVCVALRGRDAESEQVADAADIAAGCVDLLKNSVFSQCLGSQVGVGPWELATDGVEAGCAANSDEQVRVDGRGPGCGAVVKPCGDTHVHRPGEGNTSSAEAESPVDDVGELELLDLVGGEGVERDESYRECCRGVGRVQRPAHSVGVEGKRNCGVDRCRSHRRGRVREDQLACFEHGEQRPETVLRVVALRSSRWQRGGDVRWCDLGQRLMACLDPCVQDGDDPEDVDAEPRSVPMRMPVGPSPGSIWHGYSDARCRVVER